MSGATGSGEASSGSHTADSSHPLCPLLAALQRPLIAAGSRSHNTRHRPSPGNPTVPSTSLCFSVAFVFCYSIRAVKNTVEHILRVNNLPVPYTLVNELLPPHTIHTFNQTLLRC